MSPNGVSTAWVKCPLAAANKIVDLGKIQIGWAIATAQLLDARPLQCFKCLEGGHVRARCPNTADRSQQCYRCGKDDHKAKECREAASCTVCKDRGLPANHRIGGKACTGVHKGVRGLALNKLAQRGQPAPSTTGQARRAGTPASQEPTPLPNRKKGGRWRTRSKPTTVGNAGDCERMWTRKTLPPKWRQKRIWIP
ncbi:putative 50 kda protein in type i retrotransposable element r1dm [Lasius niger]|uniref:Putative 50 kDa protein in type i retrotransposable element r1dm n=1 Tax=Lasius niger TaxID=67767 RepID=A0A0J7MYB1_LASNI|nr:putative 50 kda protein in type i retrotransposable element r1dm [Lasius niger]